MVQESYRILVIDDTTSIHEDFRKILVPTERSYKYLDDVNQMLLQPELTGSKPRLPFFQIDSADQSQQAVMLAQRAVISHRPYAVAFVDILMPPGEDGVATIGQLWKIDPDIQVVICTAYAKYSWEEIVGILGQTDQLFILKKPFDSIEVVQLACSLAKKWSLRHILKEKKPEMAKATTAPSLLNPKVARSLTAFQKAVDDLAETNAHLQSYLIKKKQQDSLPPDQT